MGFFSGIRKSGFTLIELLIVISIIALLFGVGIAYYNNFNRRQTLFQAAKVLKNDLRLVQNRALSGYKDSSLCGLGPSSKILDGWSVSFTQTSYSFYGSCQGSQFGSTTVNLPGSITFNPVLSPPLQFKPLVQGVSAAVTINLVGFGETQTVTVSENGDIN